jgi:hypothetical protein
MILLYVETFVFSDSAVRLKKLSEAKLMPPVLAWFVD